MFKRILALIATLMLIAGLHIATSTPASAATMTDVTHAADDSGYTADIHIVCTNGNHRYLPTGKGSMSTGYSCGMGGVQRIVVGYNQTVYCKNYLPPYQNIYYYTGNYNEVPSYASLKCYMQRPL